METDENIRGQIYYFMITLMLSSFCYKLSICDDPI